MAFERFHLDPDLPRNLRNASNLRAEYLRGLLTRLVHVRPWAALWPRARVPTSTVAAEDSRANWPPQRQAGNADNLALRLERRGM